MSSTFNFSQFKMDLTDEEEVSLNRSTGAERKPRNLPAGLHEVVIAEAAEKGPSSGDDTWVKVSVKYQAANGNYAYATLLVPTVGLKYGPKGDLWAWKRLKGFIEAIGFEVTKDNVPELLSKLFSNVQKLEGLKLNIELKYTSHHGLYLEKGKIALVNRDGEIVHDENDEPIIESDYTTIENIANEKGLKYNGRPEVVAFGLPLKNDLSKFDKKPKKIAKPSEDTPF